MVQTNYVLCVWQPTLVPGMYFHHRQETYVVRIDPISPEIDKDTQYILDHLKWATGPAKRDLPCSNRGCALGHHHTPLAGHPIMRSTGTTISSNHWRGNSATPDNTGWRSSHNTRIPTLGSAPPAANGKYQTNRALLPRNCYCLKRLTLVTCLSTTI